MSYLLFVPGLKSGNAFSEAGQENSTSRLLREVATDLHIPYHYRAAFRNASDPCPPLAEMVRKVSDQIRELHKSCGSPGMVVCSSIGAGITLKSLSMLGKDVDRVHVVALDPVFDLLSADGSVQKSLTEIGDLLKDRNIASMTFVTTENDTAAGTKLNAFKNAAAPYVTGKSSVCVLSEGRNGEHMKRLGTIVHAQLFNMMR